MSNEAGLYRLTYVSRNAMAGQARQLDEEIGRILASSRRNNARIGVTGALLFSADCFAQALEGGFAMVQDLFEQIQRDTRHADTVVLDAGPVARREFASWSMAYAGRLEDDRFRFDGLAGNRSVADGAAGAGQVMGLLRDVVLRAPPALA